MKRRKEIWFKLLSLGLLIVLLALSGCSGDDGRNGSDGADGTAGLSAYELAVQNGFVGTEAEWLASLDPNDVLTAAANVEPESCVICHQGGVARNGISHQAIYDDYTDTTLVATITDVSSVADGAGGFDVTMTFTLAMNGLPYVDADGLPSLEQKRFYVGGYDSATGTWNTADNFSFSANDVVATATAGEYTVTAEGEAYAPELADAQAYMYVADGPLDAGSHYSLYSDVSNAGLAFGNADTYASTANVSACERCHGTPYMKHGYRAAAVDGLADFAACKSCHLDDRSGSHPDWQLLVDDHATYVEFAAVAEAGGDSIRNQINDDPELAALYAYNRTIMNDVHMSHAMEFPYPMSMSNCTTCHEGNMAAVTDPANFVAGTCKSCHPVTGVGGTDAHRAPAIEALWEEAGVTGTHSGVDWTNNDFDCTVCHGTIARTFAEFHSGYDPVIYDAATGTKYNTSPAIAINITNASLSGTDLTFDITAGGTVGTVNASTMNPVVLLGLYGYGTKDFIVNGHNRWDSNCNGVTSRSDGDHPIGEFDVGAGEEPGCPNRYWTLESEAAGAWTVTAHLADWADMIDDDIIRRVEIAVLPELEDGDGVQVAVDAPSRTFDLTANAFDDDFFDPIVDANKCDSCHDALATTFHGPERGGNVTVCRICHVVLTGGSHLELQSRSIDSYVHAVHSFQLFDIGDIDPDDPEEQLDAAHHLDHTFPNFTRLNCEACHVDATDDHVPYNVPDQSKSLPGILSGSDNVEDRNIGTILPAVTGPAARACGGCHRADFINADDANGLSAFNQHVKDNGYFFQDPFEDEQGILDIVIETIMSIFN